MPEFPDPAGRLASAYEDFNAFLVSAGIPSGKYPVVMRQTETATGLWNAGYDGAAGKFEALPAGAPAALRESCAITVEHGGVIVSAGDTEGIRRGIIHLENMLLDNGGPFLALGTVARVPWVRTRLSRCFYGPIKRPPKNRDELADGVDYYPDNYLNRLAHEGVNGLWLTITFRDTIPSKILPELGSVTPQRLDKLRRTAAKCLRYGIKTYVFCIEPAAWRVDDPALRAHPELGGYQVGDQVSFCPSSAIGRDYLREAANTMFRAVPELGGIVACCYGERLTHCASSGIHACPRCSRHPRWQALVTTVSAMAEGMHAVNPRAELIAMLYYPASQGRKTTRFSWGAEGINEAARNMPENVCMQLNFESTGGEKQLGKWRTANDYWLSYVGPSALFKACARQAVGRGARMFAKLQVGCSHEVATAPCVPAPGIIYDKYRQMRQMGVSGAMQCWYFGNFPSVMTRAAGELSFDPAPETKAEFLRKLARREWGANWRNVAKAWRWFEKGYRQYPLNLQMSYYGPMHDGVVWPLYLIPRQLPLAPTWLLQYPPSGDRIGEALGSAHTLDEAIILCRRMVRYWSKGTELLKRVMPAAAGSHERERDVRTALALNLQFRSGLNILTFYSLRECLVEERSRKRALKILKKMADIVKNELVIDRELLPLCEAESALGFHSEAEGYKYFPAKIRWRMTKLEKLLKEEFPQVEKALLNGERLFDEYTGAKLTGPVYHCRRLNSAPPMDGAIHKGPWLTLPKEICAARPELEQAPSENDLEWARARTATWSAGYAHEALYVGVECKEPDMEAIRAAFARNQEDLVLLKYDVRVRLAPQRNFPGCGILVHVNGHSMFTGFAGGFADLCETAVWHGSDTWSVAFRIPWRALAPTQRPLRGARWRMQIIRRSQRAGDKRALFWKAPRMAASRLMHDDNPATDFGWIVFE